MKESLISFETAKLAKEVGFNWEVFFGVYSDNIPIPFCQEGGFFNWNIHDRYSIPTQSLLQKWLREVHKVIVEIGFYDYGKWNYTIYNPSPKKQSSPEFSTYEECLEIGLQECLKLIKNGTTT